MRAKRTDKNQLKLMQQLRKLGFSVVSTHELGKGMGDILVGTFKRNYLFEIKNPEKPASGKKLTRHEQVFHQTWNGQIDIVETVDDVLKVINNSTTHDYT